MSYKTPNIFSTDLIVKIAYCNNKIKFIYNSLISEHNSKWNIEKNNISNIDTNFHMLSNNEKISIACSPDTGGEIETILFINNDKIDHDSIIFHEDINKLKKYLNTL